MTTRLYNILPFLVITVACIIGVEGFYFVVERFVFDSTDVEVEQQVVSEPVATTTFETDDKKKVVDYSIITRRNLFGKPPAVGGPVEEKPVIEEELEVSALEVVLMGTIGSGENSRAIILNKKDRKQEIYTIGDNVQGANIKEIRRGKVILTHNGKDEMLDMSEAAKFGSRTQRPTSVSPTMRQRTLTPQSDSTGSVRSEVQTVKPRVVRPTRRIVRPRRPVVSTPVEPTDESAPPEDQEDMDVSDDIEGDEQEPDQ